MQEGGQQYQKETVMKIKVIIVIISTRFYHVNMSNIKMDASIHPSIIIDVIYILYNTLYVHYI